MAPTSNLQSTLLTLPYELRELILQLALKQRGMAVPDERLSSILLTDPVTLELQFPIWTSLGPYSEPLFQVCRSLRTEALEAFYKVRLPAWKTCDMALIFFQTNEFLWRIDARHRTLSDPADYPAPARRVRDRVGSWEPIFNPPLTPLLPWEYPDLMRQLRNLHVELYLPNYKQLPRLKAKIEGLVRATDRGRTLKNVRVSITASGRSIIFSTRDVEAVEMLCGMEISGKVVVEARTHFAGMKNSVDRLELARRMKNSRKDS